MHDVLILQELPNISRYWKLQLFGKKRAKAKTACLISDSFKVKVMGKKERTSTHNKAVTLHQNQTRTVFKHTQQ